MENFQKNNLNKSTSPYLQQHKDNPVFWQEWNKETLSYALAQNKLILVSVGYSTCHWCHVMAEEAFSDQKIADTLNQNFVCIKVDREQRPDLDQYFMDYIVHTSGQGGWPLNIILSPDQKPFFAGTYFPIEPNYGLPGFHELLMQILVWYETHKNTLQKFKPDYVERQPGIKKEELIDNFIQRFDKEWGGFGTNNKFPPHCSLLFLMSYYEKTQDFRIAEIIKKTLDMMAQRGLHDHLQGGFFRYCTDEQWTIPHFEKMLYDQAMHLWVYSLAYKLFKKQEYKIVVSRLIECLEETFEQDSLFFAAHDAETEHQEGETYLWSLQELKATLTPLELKKFKNLYLISEQGNFEGKNHLIKKKNSFFPTIEEKLLKIRSSRIQPFTDKKIITSWNALTGIGLIMAYRFANQPKALSKAEKLFNQLIQKHYKNGEFIHSSLQNILQKEEFLEDYASMLLFCTYLHEETGKYGGIIAELNTKMNAFYQKGWQMNKNSEDFSAIPAKSYDHPFPSALSLAELARFRANKMLEKNEKDIGELTYQPIIENDFFNLFVFLQNGNYHKIHTPTLIPWKKLPLINAFQLPGERYQDCHLHQCALFENENELLKSLKSFGKNP